MQTIFPYLLNHCSFLQVNRLAICLAVPWLGATISLAAGLATILLPMHSMEELGLLPVPSLAPRDVTEDRNGSSEVMEESEAAKDYFVKYEQFENDFRQTGKPTEEILQEMSTEHEPESEVAGKDNFIPDSESKDTFEGDLEGELNVKKKSPADYWREPVKLKNQTNRKILINNFHMQFKTMKNRLMRHQREHGTAPDYVLLMRNNLQDAHAKNASPTAGKYMVFGEGPAKALLLAGKLAYSRADMFLMANHQTSREEVVEVDQGGERQQRGQE